MGWRVIDHLTDAGRHPNEDGAGIAGKWAWIADGAGTPSPPRFPEAGSDAAWLVGAAYDHLSNRHHAFDAIDDNLSALERHLGDRFGPPDTDDPAEGPTSCLGLVHITSRTAEQVHIAGAVLADVVVLAPTASGLVCWTDTRVKPFEARTFAAIAGLPRTGGTLPTAAWQQIMKNRATVNRADGYAAVSPARPWKHLAHRFKATIAPDAPVVLMTDGFFRLHDVFAAYSIGDLYDACTRGDASRLLAELRTLERADPAAERYQRFKIHDDATVLVVAA